MHPLHRADLLASLEFPLVAENLHDSVDEFAEAFAGRSIYSIGDLYSGYDQFQLAIDSRDITTTRTPIGLVRMCTLPQGATNSMAHMMNAMNKVLKNCIPDITMPFLDDIPIKGVVHGTRM